MNKFLLVPALACLCGVASADTFEAAKNRFEYNGRPFTVRAAELHYPRIPREYWNHRLEMVKALGVNTVCLYVFWNVHEPQPGQMDFKGQNDLRAFVELCRDHGLKVILRPGPYVCAEWEMGGLPWWLLKEDDIELRTDDPRFMAAVKNFEHAVADQLKGLTVADGGPLIMVQVENEYGSYGQNKKYLSEIRDILRGHYPGVQLFQCDWSSNFTLNGLDDLLWTMNFGTGTDIDSQFKELKELRPDSPLMCSEYWSGWFDRWGEPHETRPADAMVAGIGEMLDKDISFSLYMTHGGTNWGHWGGANSPGYSPMVTSYDYDAPINEQGAPTEKYHLLRSEMQRHSDGRILPPVPDAIPVREIAPFTACRKFGLSDLYSIQSEDITPKNIEKYGVGFGKVAYRHILMQDVDEGSALQFEPRDYVQVFADGKPIGILDRRNGENALPLPALAEGTELVILVDPMGRINFGTAIADRKGMVGPVVLDTPSGIVELKQWQTSIMTDDERTLLQGPQRTGIDRKLLPAEPLGTDGRLLRGLYTASFDAPGAGDTFLDMASWGKGDVWVNGHHLGRFWDEGPQQTLYLPGVWLKEKENRVTILDVIGPRETTLKGVAAPRMNLSTAKQ